MAIQETTIFQTLFFPPTGASASCGAAADEDAETETETAEPDCNLRGARGNDTPGVGIPLQPLQLCPHLFGALVTQLPVFLQRSVDNVFQFGRDVAIKPDRGRRIAIQDFIENDA